ncbi:hypothetical protein F4779DRAFT_590297 [Xylariaceae sp. FL0662B]|nr:hypothetical protein F4779DRAFT_590297 [Xylariaceae sp. FL0662B]
MVMYLKEVCVLLAIITLGLGNPVLTNKLLPEHEEVAKRALLERRCENTLYADPYKDQYDCPKKHKTNKKGQCVDGIPGSPGNTGCNGYCEVKITFVYGKEIQYNNDCRANTDPCMLYQGWSVTHSETFEVSGGFSTRDGSNDTSDHDLVAREGATNPLKLVFNLGASYSWTDSFTRIVTQAQGKPKGETRCGHWSFIPWRVRSCGTLTHSDTKPVSTGSKSCSLNPYCSGSANNGESCDKDSKLTSTPNWCVETTVTNKDGSPAGSDIFVATGCGTDRGPRPEGQDRIYYFPGVSLDPKFKGDPKKARN